MTDTAPATETEVEPRPGVPAIFAAINAVMSELGTLAKDGVGPSSQNSYPFLKVDDLVAKLSPLLVKHGVVVSSAQRDVEQQLFRFPKVTPSGDVVRDGRPDAVQIISRIAYDFTFTSIYDGSSMTSTAYGESIDTGDKGIRRSATAAWKEVLLRTFVVVTGDEDPDGLDPNDQPAQIVRNDRGAQAREKAAQPRTPRTPRGKAAESTPAPAAPEPASEPAPEPAAEPAPEPAAEPESTPTRVVDDKAPVRETQSPNEKRSADWSPDPEDVKAAEAMTPPAREVKPVEPKAPTQAEQREETVATLREEIRVAYQARAMDRADVNALGDRVTGKKRVEWFSNLNDLRTVLKAITAEGDGEAPSGF